VQATWCPQSRAPVAAWDGNVDRGWDGVDEAVAGQGCLKAERGAGDTFGKLDQVRVRRRGASPSVDATAKGDDLPGVAELV
jgi:hypothetical protein